MQTRFRSLVPITFIVLAGCSENRLGVGAVDAASNTGSGGAASGSGGAGSGDLSTSAGGAGGATSGPCGAATCLVSLFQTCVPEGDCAMHGGNSPSAAFSSICYANGVTVSYMGSSLEGRSLSVERNGLLCYSIKEPAPPSAGAGSYVVTDGNGNQVATAVTADKAGFVTVTCTGGTPITVDGSCLQPVSTSSTCDLETCPTAADAGIALDAPDADIDSSPDGLLTTGLCGEATCLIDLFQTCVPEGDCAAQLGSTAAYGVCYANGVTVTVSRSGGSETITAVERNGVLCYSIKDSAWPNYADSYVITDGNGNEVATGVSSDRSSAITVTCTGGTPITVDGSCLHSVSDYSTCNLRSCPTSGTGGYDGGTGADGAAPDAPASDADGGGQPCGDAACGPGQACALVTGGTVPPCLPPTDAGACTAGFVLVSSCRVGGGSAYYQPGCTEPPATPRCYDLPDACSDFCSCVCPSGGGAGCYPGPGYYICGYP